MNQPESNNKPLDLGSIEPLTKNINTPDPENQNWERSAKISSRINQLCALVIAGMAVLYARQSCELLEKQSQVDRLEEKTKIYTGTFELSMQLAQAHDNLLKNASNCMLESSDERSASCVRKVLDNALSKRHRIQHRR